MDLKCPLIEEFQDLTHEDEEFHRKVVRISEDVRTGASNILELTQTLGPLLSHETPFNRELGTWILSDVLSELFSNQLDSSQLNFICTFYSDRFKDNNQIIPAVLKGALALIKFDQVSDVNIIQLLSSLFHNVGCQQRPQSDRRVIYNIFNEILEKKPSAAQSMGLDFVYGVISSVDGERDPKNLLFLFEWYPKFLKTVNLKHLTEEAFEVMACYFPVDFKAPPQDDNGITRDVLADGLASCLCSIPEFAEFCLPLAVEKFESSVTLAKIDALQLLSRGCDTFPASFYSQHASILWSQIQKETLNQSNERLETACLQVLTSILRKITNESCFQTILTDICDSHKGSLLADSKIFESSSKLLVSVAKASDISSKFLAKEIVPILTNTFAISTDPKHKIRIIELATELSVIYFDFVGSDLKSIPTQCLQASIEENIDLKSTAFRCLSLQVRLLPPDLRSALYYNLRTFLIQPQLGGDVKKSIIICFQRLAEHYPIEVKENLISHNLQLNPDELNSYLGALTAIAAQIDFTDNVIDIFSHYLCKNDEEYAVTALKNLRLLIDGRHDNFEITKAMYRRDFVRKLMNWCENHEDRVNGDDNSSGHLLGVLKSIIGDQSIDCQSAIVIEFLPQVVRMFTDRKNRISLILLDAILERLKPTVKLESYRNFLQDLTSIIIDTKDEFMRNLSLQLLANLLNKCQDDDVNGEFLTFVDETIVNATVTVANSHLILAWITKALAMRKHNKTNVFIEKLIEMLKIDSRVAISFRIIMDDTYECTSSRSYCNRTFLFQQRVFTMICKKFVENYTPDFPGFLTATGYLFEHAPEKAILLQFEQISRLVIMSLDNSIDFEVLLIVLNILFNLICKKEACIENHIGDFLTRLLKLSVLSSMKVRILALRCINRFVDFPVYKLLPYKQDVLIQLGACIDDKKRLVRKEAVETRSAWYLLDAVQ